MTKRASSPPGAGSVGTQQDSDACSGHAGSGSAQSPVRRLELSARGPIQYLEPCFAALIVPQASSVRVHLLSIREPDAGALRTDVVDWELVPPKTWEAIQHLSEYD